MDIAVLYENINKLIEYIMTPSSTDIWSFIATVIAPIISAAAIVIGGGFALYKYHTTKNYEINLQILNEVYVPLYAYIVKQETFRYIIMQDDNYKLSFDENPIIEINSTKTEQKINASGMSVESITTDVCGCTRKAFIEISETTNFGLASPELVTLINMYKMVSYCSSGNQTTREKAKAIILQGKIEHALVQEILTGYNFYHNKLKLRKCHSNLYNVTNKQFQIAATITENEINAMMASLSIVQDNEKNE